MKSSITSVTGFVLTLGSAVIVHLADHGLFHGTVDRFEDEGATTVIMPTRSPVQDVFPNGYRIGQAHWESDLTILGTEPW